MPTYSFGTPPTDATKLQDLNTVLSVIPDNTSKLISPKDVRDAVYTLWENIIFKPTNSGGTEYIGIDQTDIRKKILIGKKQVEGVPVLSSNLLSSSLSPNVDVFFYNTKTEPHALGDYSTTVAFLAGTGSNYLGSSLAAPYLKTVVVTNPGFSNTLDFEIRNSSYFNNGLTGYGGDIKIESSKGFIYLNGLRFPIADSYVGGSSPQNGHLLKFKKVGLVPTAFWEAPVTFSSVTDIINPSGTVSITGNPVILNGLPINFTDNNPTPVDVGGVPAGSTFNNVPVTEVIRQILYPYIRPSVVSQLNAGLVEIGDSTAAAAVNFQFSTYRNATYSLYLDEFRYNGVLSPVPPVTPALPIFPTSIPLLLNIYSAFPNLNPTTLVVGPGSYEYFTYSVQLSDTYPTTVTASSSLAIVLPFFYGTAPLSTTQSIQLQTILGTTSTYEFGYLTPFLSEPILATTSNYNKVVELSTLGYPSNQAYVYFGYPADYPDLLGIRDSNGFDVTNNFYKFNVNISSPRGIWGGKDYTFYTFVGSASGSTTPLLTTIGSIPDYNATYSFNFG